MARIYSQPFQFENDSCRLTLILWDAADSQQVAGNFSLQSFPGIFERRELISDHEEEKRWENATEWTRACVFYCFTLSFANRLRAVDGAFIVCGKARTVPVGAALHSAVLTPIIVAMSD